MEELVPTAIAFKGATGVFDVRYKGAVGLGGPSADVHGNDSDVGGAVKIGATADEGVLAEVDDVDTETDGGWDSLPETMTWRLDSSTASLPS